MELLIYGPIGESWFEEGVKPKDIIAAIAGAAADEPIIVRINSPGGDAFDGFAIYNALVAVRSRVTVRIEGVAASAASFIAMAGSKIEVCKPSSMMIHKAMSVAMGNADEIRETADALTKLDQSIAEIYAARCGGTVEFWLSAMSAETWYTADEAVTAKLADGIFGEEALTTEKPAASVPAVKNLWRREAQPRFAAMARKKLLRSASMAIGKCTMPDGTVGDADQAICDAAGGTFEEAAAPESNGETPAANTPAPANQAPQAATLAEIEACAPGAPESFILNAIKRNLTVAHVTAENTKRLNTEVAALRKKLATAAPATTNTAQASTVIGVVASGDPGDEGAPATDNDLKARWDGDPAIRASFKNKFESFKRWDKYKDRVRVNGKPVTEFV